MTSFFRGAQRSTALMFATLALSACNATFPASSMYREAVYREAAHCTMEGRENGCPCHSLVKGDIAQENQKNTACKITFRDSKRFND